MYDPIITIAVRPIHVTVGGLTHLMSLTNYRGIFSCNASGHVWISVCKGFHREDQREHLNGQCRLLEDIVAAVLAVRPGGGRFVVDAKRVVLAADPSTTVVAFE